MSHEDNFYAESPYQPFVPQQQQEDAFYPLLNTETSPQQVVNNGTAINGGPLQQPLVHNQFHQPHNQQQDIAPNSLAFYSGDNVVIRAYNGQRSRGKYTDPIAYNLLHPIRGKDVPLKTPYLADGEDWIKTYSAEMYNWNSLLEIPYRVLIEGSLDPPYNMYSLFISKKKIVTNHVEIRSDLEDASIRRDAYTRDFLSSDIMTHHVSRPFFFAPQFFIGEKWNKIGIYVMQIWLVLSLLLQGLVAIPWIAGYIFASFQIINFFILFVAHLIMVIRFKVKNSEYCKSHMQSTWRTVVMFLIWLVVFVFDCFAYWNTTKVRAIRLLFSIGPATALMLISYIYFYPRVRFGRYATLVLRFRNLVNGFVEQRVLLHLRDCEEAKQTIEDLAKYND
jgi:hypothetical protein